MTLDRTAATGGLLSSGAPRLTAPAGAGRNFKSTGAMAEPLTMTHEPATPSPRPVGRLVPLLVAVLGVAGVATAVATAFVQDDAFISFAYARSWVEGDGLTWFGQHVEGYTNFLWVAWLALGMKAGLTPVAAAHAGSLAAYVAVLALAWRLPPATRPEARLLTLAVLATNGTFVAYATGGLETMLQAALVTGFALLSLGARRAPCATAQRAAEEPGRAAQGVEAPAAESRGALAWRRLALASVLAALALMTRLDSAVLLAPLGLRLVLHARTPRRLAALLVPGALLVGPWLAWKVATYGSVLPNTFAAKVGGFDPTGNGLVYAWRFLHAYWLWPFLLVGLPAALLRRRPGDAPALWALGAVALWFLYVIAVGGDFMELRFFVPALPLLAAVVAFLTVDVIGARVLRPAPVAAVAGAVLVAASALHVQTARPTPDFALDTIDGLRTFYGLYPDERWDRVGAPLGEALEGTDALIALHAVGAIPYYSRLRTVDMLGLTDAQIAREGIPAPPTYRRPGHRRMASLAQLRARGVNLVLAAPTVLPTRALREDPAAPARLRAWPRSGLWFEDVRGTRATVVAIPISPAESILAWYLTPSPALDARIRERGWPTWTFTL